MTGRFGKYGDIKRKINLRKARHVRPVDLQKVAKKRSSRRSRSTSKGGGA